MRGVKGNSTPGHKVDVTEGGTENRILKSKVRVRRKGEPEAQGQYQGVKKRKPKAASQSKRKKQDYPGKKKS